jgi:hypothetical protein
VSQAWDVDFPGTARRGMSQAGFHHVADLVVARVLAIRQVWVQG